MGDGTTNGGPFYESLNLAKIYHLPVIFFVVNNGYGMGLKVEQGSAISDLYRKAHSYDIASERVDGTDPIAVRDAMRRAAKLAREQHEPSLIEAVSFRFRGHSAIDPDHYRDKEEVKHGRMQDPIIFFAERLKAIGLLDDDKISAIDEQVEQEIDEIVRFAEDSPFPAEDTLFDYIYADDSAHNA
jgi:pyruvate dehydrogenase E1 component alpha subunit